MTPVGPSSLGPRHSGNSSRDGSGNHALAVSPTTYATVPTIADAYASFAGAPAPGMLFASCVVTSAAIVPIIRPPTLAAQVGRIDARQIVAPEAELPDRRDAVEEDAPLHQLEAAGRDHGEDDRHEDEARHLEQPNQLAAADDAHGEEGEEEAADQPADLLIGLHRAHRLLNGGARQPAQLRKPGHDPRRLLDRAERAGVGRRHHHRGHDRGAREARLEQLAEARTLQRARLLLRAPGRRLRQERPD